MLWISLISVKIIKVVNIWPKKQKKNHTRLNKKKTLETKPAAECTDSSKSNLTLKSSISLALPPDKQAVCRLCINTNVFYVNDVQTEVCVLHPFFHTFTQSHIFTTVRSQVWLFISWMWLFCSSWTPCKSKHSVWGDTLLWFSVHLPVNGFVHWSNF